MVVNKELREDVPFEGQKKRMLGKFCFNLPASDEALDAELGELTQADLRKYGAKNWL